MANRYFFQFTKSLNHELVILEGSFVVDSGLPGKTRSVKGSGIKSITQLGVGTYEVRLEDAYNRYLSGTFGTNAILTGANVADGAFVVGTTYVITSVGTTTFNSYGLPAGVTAAPGVAFVATAIGGAGTGTVKAVTNGGVFGALLVGDPNLTIKNSIYPYYIFETLNAAGAATTPTDGTVIGITAFLRNSSVKGKGE